MRVLFVLVMNIDAPFCANVNKLNIIIIIINTIIIKRQIHLLSLSLQRLIFAFQKSFAGSRISTCGNPIRLQIKTISS